MHYGTHWGHTSPWSQMVHSQWWWTGDWSCRCCTHLSVDTQQIWEDFGTSGAIKCSPRTGSYHVQTQQTSTGQSDVLFHLQLWNKTPENTKNYVTEVEQTNKKKPLHRVGKIIMRKYLFTWHTKYFSGSLGLIEGKYCLVTKFNRFLKINRTTKWCYAAVEEQVTKW